MRHSKATFARRARSPSASIESSPETTPRYLQVSVTPSGASTLPAASVAASDRRSIVYPERDMIAERLSTHGCQSMNRLNDI